MRDNNTYKKSNEKLPFAIFICPKNIVDKNIEDYKQVFTDIISDRIKEKYR